MFGRLENTIGTFSIEIRTKLFGFFMEKKPDKVEMKLIQTPQLKIGVIVNLVTSWCNSF